VKTATGFSCSLTDCVEQPISAQGPIVKCPKGQKPDPNKYDTQLVSSTDCDIYQIIKKKHGELQKSFDWGKNWPFVAVGGALALVGIYFIAKGHI